MSSNSNTHSIASLVTSGLAALAIPAVTTVVLPQNEFRGIIFLALVAAITSVILAVTGLVKARREKNPRRAPGILGLGLGGVLTLIYTLIYWLSTPF